MTSILIAAIIALTNECGRIEVNTFGANVLSYVPAGGEEVLFRQPKPQVVGTRYDGGIPVCWPWFGWDGDPGSMQHGFVREREWKVLERTETAEASRLLLGLEAQGEYRLEYEIVLGRRLSLDLRMRNMGKERIPITTGLHPYFSISHPTNVVVKMPDKDIRCGGAMDGGLEYGEGTYVVTDEGKRRQMRLDFHGNNRVVIWNCGPDEQMDGMYPEDWKRYICVEPVVFPRAFGFYLAPNESRAIGMEIGVSGMGNGRR